jgi:flagellin-specific chaperone FliS
MKIITKILAILLLSIILTPLVFAQTSTTTTTTQQTTQQKHYYERGGWKVFTNGIITVLIVGNGSKPMFIWWYNKDNTTAYVFKYEGLAEIWLPTPQFKHIFMFNDEEDYQEQLHNLIKNATHGKTTRETLEDIIDNVKELMKLKLVDEKGKVNTEEIDKALSIIQNLKEKINNLTQDDLKTQLLTKLNDIQTQLENLKNNPTVENAVKVMRNISQLLPEVMRLLMDRVRMVVDAYREIIMAFKHPFYFPFDAAKWSLIGPENITDGKGNIIGMQFSFNLTEVHDKRFKFAEGNILIRNRFYFVPVQEKINNQTMNITRAELKSDIIIKHWEWNFYEAMKHANNNKTIEPFIINILSAFKPTLILKAHFTAPRMPSDPYKDFNVLLKQGGEDEVSIGDVEVETHGEHGLKLGVNMENDTEIGEHEINKVRMPGLIIKTSQGLVGGFFRFVPNATVTYPNGTKEIVPVKGYFILHGKHVTTFLVYQYFDNGTLEHDPSIGIETPEVSQETPVYQVSTSGGQVAVQPITTTSTSITSSMTSSTTATQAQSITTSGGITSTPIQQNYITIAVIATVILLITVMLVMRRRNNV